MNAMNWVFVPNGLTPGDARALPSAARYRTFYSRRDVLWGLAQHARRRAALPPSRRDLRPRRRARLAPARRPRRRAAA